jgi:CheY-like chemotaxis protein
MFPGQAEGKPAMNLVLMKPGKICLLIDDDTDDQEIFTLALENVNKAFSCRVSGNPIEALAGLADAHTPLPDYIFLDLNMPRMNGKECLKEIKKNKRLKDIPVIIYTTSSLSADREEIYKLGASDFITKPYSLNELAEVLCAFFRRQKEPLLN